MSVVIAGGPVLGLAIGSVLVERRSDHPLLPIEFLGRRNFALALLVGFAVQLAYMGGFIISPLSAL